MKNGITYTLVVASAVAALTGCSTTSRLTEGQTLYTGVKKISIESVEKGKKRRNPGVDSLPPAAGKKRAPRDERKVPGSVSAAIKAPLSVKPNNPLVSPWLRTPLPVGLWAWNSLETDKKRGLGAWLYRTLAKEPVLVERDVQPALRVRMVEDILDNHGYFDSRATWKLYPDKVNPKKARLGYTVTVARPWYYATVGFPVPIDTLTREIAAMQRTSNVTPGRQYNIDTLTRERIRITSALRARGYYYFRPSYIEYRADTTRVAYGVDLRMRLAEGIPPAALRPYTAGKVTLRLLSADADGEADSIEVGGTRVWYEKPLRLRRSVISRAMNLHPGERATLPAINRMLDNLTRLGSFRYVNMEVTPLDSLRGGDPLDMTVTAQMETPMQGTIEADLAYKSSSFLGPSLAVGLSHNNIFKGGERLSLKLNGAYEWQTGNTSAEANATAVNSYEAGLTASLSFPRMIVPERIVRAMDYGGTTTVQLGGSLTNRPKFFQMLSFNFTGSYDFRTSPTVTHTLTPLKMVYNNLLRTTAAFDAMMAENPAVALGFADQFIPSGSWLFTFDRRFGYMRGDRFGIQTSLTTAGNLWNGVRRLFGGRKGVGRGAIFGVPFSQFLKETVEVRYFKRVGQANTLAFRLFVGAGHALGNSSVLPYTEQFFVGGSASIRAFTIRSLGPGSYRADRADRYGYFDQTGDVKLEANAEFRFGIAGSLAGAVFLDAGNVWLQKEDPSRPGGRLGSGGFFDQLATGTGAGLRYDLGFLVLRLDVGIGIHLPYATGRRGYYNIARFRDGVGIHFAIGYPF